MAITRDTAAVFPVSASGVFPNTNYTTNPPYSGNFIPSVWSAKLNAKFYASTVFAEIANTDWQGEISGMGDKVIINTAPTITVSNYTAGTGLTYQVPTPDVIEMVIDKAKAFAFQINDVLDYQAKPNLLDMFSADAGEQMKIAIDSTVLYNTIFDASSVNVGATAGKLSDYNMGTPVAPVVLNATAGHADNVLTKILQMSSILDEQNVPESGRFLLIDPATRTLLMNTNLAQAQFMGDSSSMVRNGKIGTIDRFTVYVTNQLPRIAAGASTAWTSGDGSETSRVSAGTNLKSRALVAGHKSAITFASQITKMETVRAQYDFGDYIRSLNVYGYKTVKPEALVFAVVQ